MQRNFGSLDRREAVKTLLADRGNLLVVSGLGSSSYDVFDVGENLANFYLWGAMGGAAMVGLGLALAQPKRPVAVVTGDGEQLMGLGSLLTVAAKKPANLSIIVLDNGHFGETGMQKSHSGLGARLKVIAAARALRRSRRSAISKASPRFAASCKISMARILRASISALPMSSAHCRRATACS